MEFASTLKAMPTPLRPTGDDAADELLQTNPLALMTGMLLDQQVAIEWAFAGPLKLQSRLAADGHSLDAVTLAAMNEDDVVALFVAKPALHRYPAVMARRAKAMAEHILEHHGGDPADIWTAAENAADLRRRLMAVPGYGKDKTQIFIALLAKRFGVEPDGWQKEAGRFAAEGFHSVADLDSPDAVTALREHRAALKAAKKKG